MAETSQGEVVLVLEAEMLVNSSDYIVDFPCELQVSQLSGCYSCIEGSEISISCRSKQSQFITLSCESHEFTIECGPHNITTKQKLDFYSAFIDITCHTQCGGSKATVPINGTLVYHPSTYQSVFQYNSVEERNNSLFSLVEINFPDLTPLLRTCVSHWKAALVAVTASITMAGLTYLFGPVVIITLLKIAFFVARSVITFVFYVISKILRLILCSKK
ncbi:hypothetical protein Y032_0457g1819 [Ancylostoma ceylanicum]|uniref:Phlebovirus glycoprotein G2 C-terminal domain-containing protein n=1 Tax=Ancylostoma ceylanicum TaxID=53326 RepID=A0A016WZB8_9BILA|nr:hypothetical protein Y032_0457g1819 [Ancylostoma ceylanicum]